MLKNIKIQNYRGIKDLEIKDFKRINLLVGDNNSGKTSVLEAIFLAFKPYGVALAKDLYGTRNLPVGLSSLSNQQQNQNILQADQYWSYTNSIFRIEKTTKDNTTIETKSNFGFEIQRKILLKLFSYSEDYFTFDQNAFQDLSKLENKNQIDGDFLYISTYDQAETYDKSGFPLRQDCYFTTGVKKSNLLDKFIDQSDYPTRDNRVKIHKDKIINYSKFKIFYYNSKFHTSFLKDHLDILLELGKKKVIIDILKKIDPTIENFNYDSEGQIQVEKHNGYHHLNLLGDGAIKIFAFLCSIIARCRNGILLIDEIDNGLHWKTQKIMWEAVIEASKEANVQIFATTHSYEIIEALEEFYQENGKKILGEDQIRLFRIKKIDQENKVISYDSKELEYTIEDEREVR